MASSRLLGPVALLAWLAWTPALRADDLLAVDRAVLDRPTLVTLGVQLLVSGDDDRDASVSVRYRKVGASSWRDGPPLFRVRPETVVGRMVPAQFAGSVFELAPGTAYEIELHAFDPDGTDQRIAVMATTRPLPSDPGSPRAKRVTDASSLRAALGSAEAGDVITLANGSYTGTFELEASGTAAQPIVIRGASEDGVVLDGGGCSGCNVLEVYGSFVHLENLTLAHASRALRFQGQGAEANVVRHVHVLDTTLGIGSKPDQKDFYLCDNTLEGRLAWPMVYADDNGAHANDDGIHVEGDGHVICHNRVIGYGDALKTEQDGARAIDFYGNDVLSAYDNGIELDGSEGNVRCFRNRFTNTYATISFQPIFGGPVYALHNVIVNVANEQMKFHARAGIPTEEPSGILVYHNTFVSALNALANHTSDASHHFVIENNLFVSAAAAEARTLDWSSPIDDGSFDYDGYYPDGIFDFDFGAGYQKLMSFALARAAQPGFEPHGFLLTQAIFASGLTAPASYDTALMPADVTLAATSNAIDQGTTLPGINDGYTGRGPDLGALERGCPIPLYGVRPEGTDDSNESTGCGGPSSNGSAGIGGSGSAGGAAGQAAVAVHGSSGRGGAAGVPIPTPVASGGVGGSGGTPATRPPAKAAGCGCRLAAEGPRSRSVAGLATLCFVVAVRVIRRRRITAC